MTGGGGVVSGGGGDGSGGGPPVACVGTGDICGSVGLVGCMVLGIGGDGRVSSSSFSSSSSSSSSPLCMA